MTHRIDKNIPVPPTYSRPWPQMEAGDSIEVLGDYPKASSVYKSGRWWTKKYRSEWRVTMRKIETGRYRIWLVAREPDQ